MVAAVPRNRWPQGQPLSQLQCPGRGGVCGRGTKVSKLRNLSFGDGDERMGEQWKSKETGEALRHVF